MTEQVNGEDVVQQAQKIAALLQLGTFLRAADLAPKGPDGDTVGTQVLLQLMDRQQTRLYCNSKLIRDALMAEFNRLGEELTAAGVNLDNLMDAERRRFDSFYNQQSN